MWRRFVSYETWEKAGTWLTNGVGGGVTNPSSGSPVPMNMYWVMESVINKCKVR